MEREVARASERKTPVNPPIRKLKKKAKMNSIGVPKRVRARHSVPNATR